MYYETSAMVQLCCHRKQLSKQQERSPCYEINVSVMLLSPASLLGVFSQLIKAPSVEANSAVSGTPSSCPRWPRLAPALAAGLTIVTQFRISEKSIVKSE